MSQLVSKGQRWQAKHVFRLYTAGESYLIYPSDTIEVMEDGEETIIVCGVRVCRRRVLWQGEVAFILSNRFDGESLYPLG